MIKVIIADDHDLIRDGFKKLVAGEPDITVIGEARSAEELFGLLRESSADVLVLDIGLPDENGIEVLKDIKSAGNHPEMSILILSMHPEGRYARRALAAGAAGYMTKDTASEQLIPAIRRVRGRGRYISQALAEELAAEVGGGNDAPPHTKLSDREYELLLLIGEGKSVREIGDELALSVNTINSYRSRLMQKMDLHSNAEIIHYALRHNLVE
jgi:two-component system, NarL family, invasion response regulator UvrY